MEATEFTESLPENFEPFCSISFHDSITRDERKIVLDCLPDEHPVKGISVPYQRKTLRLKLGCVYLHLTSLRD